MEEKLKQLSEEEAIALHNSGEWKEWDAKQIVELQLFQCRLMIPFDVFQRSLEEVFDRPIWTHELDTEGTNRLRKEYNELQT